MRVLLASLVIALFALSLSESTAQTATQTVTFNVQAIYSISVSGDPGTLSITSATTPPGYDAVSDATTTYNVVHNVAAGARITAKLDSDMPANLTLTINLASTKGTSAGPVDISGTGAAAVNVVTGIALGADVNQTITYTLDGTMDSGTIASDSRTVTLTLTAP